MKQQCLYTDELSDSNRWLTLQGIPNHTTYEHSKSLTWEPFTTSQPHPYPRVLSTPISTRLRAGCFRLAHSPCPQRGGLSSKAYPGSNSKILQVTSVYRAHKHGM